MNKLSTLRRSFTAFGIVMVVSTISLVGLVAFQFLEAQDNTQIATTATPDTPTKEPTPAEIHRDIDTVTEDLDTSELDALDAELDAAFDF